jgi:predicted esterase
MATYRRFVGGPQITDDTLLSLAISGWLRGADAASENLPEALALADTRDLVRQFMQESNKIKRDQLLNQIKASEFISPKVIADLVSHMTPNLETPPQEVPGLYEFTVTTTPDEAAVNYAIQLPPEYDPHYSYPCVVTLHGTGSTPKQQIEWWAGPLEKSKTSDRLIRNGQAGRNGYIVIAPNWTTPHQTQYEGTAREHAAVLAVLRDACRKFAIDTDRVFLSGHAAGGNAAWDIGLAHPDLWAGVIPIVATAEKTVQQYWKNAEKVPLYFVCGEMDGDKMVKNGPEFNRYLNRTAPFDCTVVEYEGRGHEHFSDDILHIFDWMGRKQRNFFPKQFSMTTQRPFDNFFWWLELRNFQPNGRSFQVEANILPSNGVVIHTNGKLTVWLSPDMVDFNRPISVIQGDKRIAGPNIKPDMGVLLEDVRGRGDRKHPFWAKIEP